MRIPPSRKIPVSPYQAFGLVKCARDGAIETRRFLATEFGMTYRGSLQGLLQLRYITKRLLGGSSEFKWEVRQRDYYGRDADPESMLASYPLVVVAGNVGIVPFNATHTAVPRSMLMRTGMTQWDGSAQEIMFDPEEYGGRLGWAIPEDLDRVLFMRYLVDRTTVYRDKLFGFDLVEYEAGAFTVREIVVPNLEAYGSEDEGLLPEPAATPRPNLDPTEGRAGPFEDVTEDEPVVALKDGAFAEEKLN